VSLALLELFLRLFFPLYPSPYQPDEVLLVKIVPNSKKAFTRLPINGGQRIVSQFNSHGFRGPELRPMDHLRRVIVYGDSNVEAEFSELPATFPRQLESRLRRVLGPGVEVLNAGVAGYGPDQVSLRLAGDLADLKPALVVVVVFADNDFGDLIRNRIFRLNSQGEIEQRPAHLASNVNDEIRRAAYPTGIRRLQLERYARRLFWMMGERWASLPPGPSRELFNDYVNLSLELNFKTFQEYMSDRAGEGPAADPFYDYYDADIALEPESPSARYKVALMEKVLIRLRDTTTRFGAELVLTILPSALDICDHYDFRVDTARYPQYDRMRLSGLLETLAARNDIPYLNLWPRFRETDANRYYFHGGDNHWNDAGQAEAARLLAILIEDRGLLHEHAH